MNYPLISEYINAVKAAEENFDQLRSLRPVLDDLGEPVMSSGNFAVVFKMKDEQTGKLHAVKCFLKNQEGRAEAYRMISEELEQVNSSFLTPFKYLENELFVDSKNSEETEFPVLLMDWVEGITLDRYVVKNKYDGFKLSCMVHNFYDLSTWLLSMPFAHGDLKPDNIIVTEDDSFVLIDYDGMYVPRMFGQEPREQGSPNYRIPLDYSDGLNNSFSKRIDDFAIIHILLTLRIYSIFPYLISEEKDFALFGVDVIHDVTKSSIFQNIITSGIDAQTCLIITLFQKLVIGGTLSKKDWMMIELKDPKENYIDLEESITNLDNIILAVNLAYSSMLYKDPARNEYSINEYSTIEKRVCLAVDIQEKLRKHEWPYDMNEFDISYSYLKPNGNEYREGIALDLGVYALRYLFGLVKYLAINKEIPQNVYGGGKDVFTLSYSEDKYESYLNDFVKTQKLCAKKYKYLYVFDIRNFFKSVNLSKLKDLYFDNCFSNVIWYDVLFSELLVNTKIQGLNPCSEVDFFLANLYLSPLDIKMAQINGIEYFRYDDDIRVYSNNKKLLDKLSLVIKSALFPLSLDLNTEKTKLIDTKDEQLELAKACFIWSSRLCFNLNDETYLLKGKNLAKIIENDLTTTYIFKLLKDLNEGAYDNEDFLYLHLDNMFYILKNVHKNATLYRVVSELIFDRGIENEQNMLVFSEILKRIIEVLKDDEVEAFVKYWIIRTYYCSDKYYYKQYTKKEEPWVGQHYWPRPCYNDQIIEILEHDFRKKGADTLLFHISDFVISYIDPTKLNEPEVRINDTNTYDSDDLPF